MPSKGRKIIDSRSQNLFWVALAFSCSIKAQGITELEPQIVRAPPIVLPGFDQPVSHDVVERTVLQRGQPQLNISETLGRVPGVVAQNRQNYAQDIQVSVRGFGARSPFGVRGVRLYADGIPATMPDGQGQTGIFDLPSANRIEVLRGPFSALYGNAAGGIIHVFSEEAPEQPTFTSHLATGSFASQQFNLNVGAKTGADMVVSATFFKTDGFREHSRAERQQLNAKFKFPLGDGGSLSLIANTLRQPGTQDPLGLSQAQVAADPSQADAAAILFNTRKDVSNQQLGLVYEQDGDERNKLKITGHYGLREVRQFLAVPIAAQNNPLHSGGVIDLDRDFGGIDLRWTHTATFSERPLVITSGVNFETSNERRRGYQNFSGGRTGVLGALRRDEDDRVSGANQFAQIEWQITPKMALSGGLRATQVKFKSSDRYITNTNPDDSGQTKFTDVSPVAGIVYHLNPLVNVYASVGRGFETPTFNELSYRNNGLSGLNFDLEAAKSRHYEAGLKILGEKHKFNAALFRIDSENEIMVASNSGGRSVFQNGGATQRLGAELSLDYRWGNGFSLSSAATYLDAVYKNQFFSCATVPCTAPTLVAAGNRIPGIPHFIFHSEFLWQSSSGFYAALEARYQSTVMVNDVNSQSAAAYGMANFRLGFEQNFSGWQLKEFLRIDNLFNKNYIGAVIVNESNQRYFEPAPGRNFLLGLALRHEF